jgi:hypothetical protein
MEMTEIRYIFLPACYIKINKLLIVVFWVVVPCSLVGVYERFGGNTASTFRVKVIKVTTEAILLKCP